MLSPAVCEVIAMTTLLLFLGRWLLRYVVSFLSLYGLKEHNYRAQAVPTAGGLLIWLLVMLASALTSFAAWLGFPGILGKEISPAYAAAWNAVALLGFIDDVLGTQTKAKGIAGHWRLWREKRLISTGMLKAGGILLAGIPVVAGIQQELRAPWYSGMLQLLLLGLIANAVNLLDLRPGRALKGFWIMLLGCGLCLIYENPKVEALSSLQNLLPDMLPVLCGAWILLWPDLRGKVMLGDTGANLLGFALGCWVIEALSWGAQCSLLAGLLFMHGLTWRWSLSLLIERSRMLSWLDRLGRGGEGKIGGA